MEPLTTNSTTSSEKLSEICEEAKNAGLVIRYDTIVYRDQEINFLSDVTGEECWAQWNGELIDLGKHNLYYKEDMCKFIDRRLDFITDFRDCPNYVGAVLEYFNNGGYRDVRLLYKGRIIKIFLIAGEVCETLLIERARETLFYSGLLENC